MWSASLTVENRWEMSTVMAPIVSAAWAAVAA